MEGGLSDAGAVTFLLLLTVSDPRNRAFRTLMHQNTSASVAKEIEDKDLHT